MRESPATDLEQEFEPGMVGGGASAVQQLGWRWRARSARGWPVGVSEGAGKVEGVTGKLTTALVWAEEDRREGLNIGAELRAEQPW